MQLLINTGGKGTRLYPLTIDLPKPMLPVGGKPVLEHLVEWGKQYGVTEIIMLNGFKHEMIEGYFGDGEKWGVTIKHSNEPKPLGSGGPLKYAYDQGLISKQGPIIFIMGDVICHVNLKKMIAFHQQKKSVLTILVHKSDHPEDSDLIQIDDNARVTSMIKKGTLQPGQPFINLTNAGLTILEPQVFEYLTEEVFTYEHYVYQKLIDAHEPVYGYDTGDYIKDMGSPKRLEKVTTYLQELESREKVKAKYANNAVFLDRDGVINVDVEFAHKNHQLQFIPRSLEALKLLAKSDYKILIVTNQPVIGRGMCTEEEYLQFEKYLLEKIRDAGGRIDKCYYCPHHPTAGKGKYLKDCDCRKPKPGLLLQAKKEFNIDMKQSFMIGDKRSDIAAGKSTGCKTILVKTGYGGKGGDTDSNIIPDYIVDDLYDAINKVIFCRLHPQ